MSTILVKTLCAGAVFICGSAAVFHFVGGRYGMASLMLCLVVLNLVNYLGLRKLED